MNLTCCEETNCSNRVTLPKGYCYLHKKNRKIILPLTNNKIILSNSKSKIQLPNKISLVINDCSLTNDIIQDCPICLCEIDKDEDDTGLICMHKFHVDCLNHIEKFECPVCKGPLEFI